MTPAINEIRDLLPRSGMTIQQLQAATGLPHATLKSRLRKGIELGALRCGSKYRYTDVTTAPRVLVSEDRLDTLLAVVDGLTTVQAFAEDLGITPNAASARMCSAAKVGLIRRTPESNAKVSFYEATEAGREYLAWKFPG